MIVAVAVVSIVGLGRAANASGEHGGIVYVREPVLEQMSERRVVLASPDSRNVYVLGGYDNRTTVAVVARDPRTGKLSRPPGQDGCLLPWYSRSKTRTCRRAPALNNSVGIAVTPDGRDVAVGGYVSGQVALFRRNDVGGLHFRSCLGRDVPGLDCGRFRAGWRVGDLAFSPDGRNLYAAAGPDDPALVVLARNPTSGRLSELAGAAGCIQRRGRKQAEDPRCAEVPAAWFSPAGVRVSADGRTVVVVSNTAREGQGIFVFSRDPATGALTWLSCFVARGKPPCEPYPDNAPAIVPFLPAPDGRSLLVVGGGTSGAATLAVLGLDADAGTIAVTQCLTRAPIDGCEQAEVPTYALALALAADGHTVYVGGTGALRAYSRSGSGRLGPLQGPLGCVAISKRRGCTILGGREAFAFHSLAPTPDGRSLYAATGGKVVAFRVVP